MKRRLVIRSAFFLGFKENYYQAYYLLKPTKGVTNSKVLTPYCQGVHPGWLSCTPWTSSLYTLVDHPVQGGFSG